MTEEEIEKEMDIFESIFPLPSNTHRCGNGYVVTSYNAWAGHSYCDIWKGWLAKAKQDK